MKRAIQTAPQPARATPAPRPRQRPSEGWLLRAPGSQREVGPYRRRWIQGQITRGNAVPLDAQVFHPTMGQWIGLREAGFQLPEARGQHVPLGDEANNTLPPGYLDLARLAAAKLVDAVVLGGLPALWTLASATNTLGSMPLIGRLVIFQVLVLAWGIALEALALRWVSRTPGQLLLGVRVNAPKQASSLRHWFIRSAGAAFGASGAYVLPLMPITGLLVARALRRGRALPWDQGATSAVSRWGVGQAMAAISMLLTLMAVILSALSSLAT